MACKTKPTKAIQNKAKKEIDLDIDVYFSLMENTLFIEEFPFHITDQSHEWVRIKGSVNCYNHHVIQCKKCSLIAIGALQDNYLPIKYRAYSKLAYCKQNTCSELCIKDILE